MLKRLALVCCATLLACFKTIVDPAPTRDIVLRVFNGSPMTLSNIRISGGVDDLFSSVKALEHGGMSDAVTVKTARAFLTVLVDQSSPTRQTFAADAQLLTEARLSSPTEPLILTLRFEGQPARLIAELSQPVED